MANFLVAFFRFLVLAYAGFQAQASIIRLGSKLYPHNKPWLSPSGIFAFGFYKKDNGFAVGIWLLTGNSSETIVTWTANRDDPPIRSDAYLEFTREGRLLIWTKQSMIPISGNLTEPETSAALLDSGNFVIYNKTNYVIWESFDYPTDTILPGQFLYSENSLVSSVSMTDRSSGRFALRYQSDGNIVAYPIKSQEKPLDAYWSTQTFGRPVGRLSLTASGHLFLNMSTASTIAIHTVARSSYSSRNDTTVYRATLDHDGNLRLYTHIFKNSSYWTTVMSWEALQNQCQIKGYCDVNSYCSTNASADNNCFCFPGFIYIDPKMKFLGCYRNFSYKRICAGNEASQANNFTVIKHIKIDAYPYAVISKIQDECRDSCMNDCNCWAAQYLDGVCNKYTPPFMYATQNSSYSEVAFIKKSQNISQEADQFPLLPWKKKDGSKRKRKIVLILTPPLGFLAFLFTLLAVFSFLVHRRKVFKYQKLLEMETLGQHKEFTLRAFSYSELERATEGFKAEIGRISYGKIYEGIISQGSRKVAVKRLEKVEDEGEKEFIAEMTAMSRVHHRNVVQLVGFCLEGAKKLLVYEFMQNRSLADVLNNTESLPTWKQRTKIALDVARGIRYIHEECETRIIHCNIEPKNVLVDGNWTAKISNFGSAKLQMPNQTEHLAMETTRKRYSPPEWRNSATISPKVDLYDYGFLLLETICCTGDMAINVLSGEAAISTWIHECLVAKDLRNLVGDEDVEMDSLERMVKIGLICIQSDPNLRPSIKDVVLMLEGIIHTPVHPSTLS